MKIDSVAQLSWKLQSWVPPLHVGGETADFQCICGYVLSTTCLSLGKGAQRRTLQPNTVPLCMMTGVRRQCGCSPCWSSYNNRRATFLIRRSKMDDRNQAYGISCVLIPNT
ncbi:hypothetical protein KC336_g55 [Hortaea werneckii]|nr:hypothetical protein KC336_g55 [Hortaea werneckii]